MEGAFKTFFTLAVLVFCSVVVGVFLIILKILLLFYPELHVMGLTVS